MQREAAFFVRVSMADCPAQVLVNGIPVLTNDDAHRIDVTLPVTEHMVPGVNTVAWELLLEDDRLPEEARARATLIGGPATTRERRDLFSVDHAGPVPGTVVSPPEQSPIGPVGASHVTVNPQTGIALLERRIELAIRMPRWAWITAPVIPNTPETLASITSFYRQLVNLLETRQRDALIALHAEKTRELAVAHGLSSDTILGEIALPDICNDPEWRLVPPAWSPLFVDTAADGRLARLLHPETGPLIVYRSDEGLYQSFDIWLRRGGADWVLAR